MVSTIKIAIAISASLRGSKAFREAETNLKGVAKAIERTKAELALLAGLQLFEGFAALGRGAGLAVGSFLEFNEQIARVRALLDDPEALDPFIDKIRELGRTGLFNAAQVTEALFFLKQSGLELGIAMDALTPTLNLATLAMIDVGEAAEIMTDIAQAMGEDLTDLNAIAGILAKTFQTTNTSITQLAQAMKFAAPISRGLGIPLEEVSAALGLLASQGLKAGIAGRGLKNVLARLISPTAQMQRQLDDLGVQVFDAEGNFVGLTSILSQFQDMQLSATEATRIAFDLFEKRGGAIFEALLFALQDTTLDLEGFTKELENAGNQAEESANVVKEETFAAFKQFKNVLFDVGIEIGNALIPFLERLMELFVDDEGNLTNFANDLVNIAKVLGEITVIVAELGPLLILLLRTITFLMSGPILVLTALLDVLNGILFVLRAIGVTDIGPIGTGGFLGNVRRLGIPGFDTGIDIFQAGTPEVKQSGLAFVHKGERIIPSFESSQERFAEGRDRREVVMNNTFIVGNIATAEEQLFEQRRMQMRLQFS